MDAGESSTVALTKLKERLRRLRHERRLSMVGLERKAGLGHTTASQALNGSSVPSEATVIALARALRTDPDPLLALRRQATAVSPTGIRVTARIISRPLDEEKVDEAIGTPVYVQEDRDTLLREFLLTVAVINEGKQALQIVEFAVESLAGNTLTRVALTPAVLPAVLESRTRLVMQLQKEPIDYVDAITFIGVIDALGRRHGLPPSEVCAVARGSWRLPSRVGIFCRRDDPTYFVRAYQLRFPTELTTRELPADRGLPEIIATRAMLGLSPPEYPRPEELGQLTQEQE